MTSKNGANSTHGNAQQVPFRDPAVYAEYQKRWDQIPVDAAAWLQRAKDVADVLAVDAAVRDQENKSPRAEIALLKHAGLLKILGPKKYGGGEQPWSVGYKVIRKVAEADGCVEVPSALEPTLMRLQVHRYAPGLSLAMEYNRKRGWK